MGSIKHLLHNNVRWAAQAREEDPDFFKVLAAEHKPKYLWIGCADARVPANELLGLKPGDVFVHRNIGNQVPASDSNSLAVIQYAVETLRVTDIIVCGHYGCGGVQGALGWQKVGDYVEHWVSPIREVSRLHQEELDGLPTPVQRANRLAELNVREQVLNVCDTSFARQAWDMGRALSVHGLVYAIGDGILHSLGLHISGQSELDAQMSAGAAAVFVDTEMIDAGEGILAADEPDNAPAGIPEGGFEPAVVIPPAQVIGATMTPAMLATGVGK